MGFTLNEEIKIRTNKKLRDAIHDIVSTLEGDEYFDLGTISNILRDEYGLFVTPSLLERLLILWDDKKDGVFLKSDKIWLNWNKDDKWVENNISKRKRPGVLGKGRRRIVKTEKEEKLKTIKENGWVKLRDGRFVYKGPETFKIEDGDYISISIYEKESYGDKENPITPELIRNIYVLDHPRDAVELSSMVQDLIDKNEIKSKPKNGDYYYYECFMKLMKIVKEKKLDDKRGWEKKYAPSKLKEKIIRRNKRINWEKQQEKEAMETVITDRNKAIEELKKTVNPNDKFFALITRYSKNVFFIKKILYGNVTISKDTYSDGYYKVVILDKKTNEDIIFFNTLTHFNRAMKTGIKGEDKHVFNIIKGEEIEKLKIYFNELKKYKGWDEYLDTKMVDKLKNDF